MKLTPETQQKWAEDLWGARKSVTRIPVLSQQVAELDHDDAYAIQQFTHKLDRTSHPRFVGYKVGLTSREAQRQFGVFQPDLGKLRADMAVATGDVIDLTKLIQPKIEGEIAFVMENDVKGPGVTLPEVISAIGYAVPALEIVDCRYESWKITAPDLVADNGASALFVLGGKPRKISDLNLPFLGMTLSWNGEVMNSGAGAAVMGHPLNAVTFLANRLAQTGEFLKAGDVVLSGALSAMLPLQGNSFYDCEIAELGKVAVRSKQGGI